MALVPEVSALGSRDGVGTIEVPGRYDLFKESAGPRSAALVRVGERLEQTAVRGILFEECHNRRFCDRPGNRPRMTEVPLPASALLLLVALGGLTVLARRRNAS